MRPGLYGIADAGFGDPVALGRMLLAGGAGTLQLRCKGWPVRRVAEAARALWPHCRAAGVPLVINDHASIVRAGVGDGLHLGWEDGPLARSTLPPGSLLGRSTHDLAQVASADADYLGFGPVFSTDTKREAGAPLGAALLARACAASSAPVVAIGGIGPSTLPEVRAAGAHAWAVIGAILGEADVVAAARRFAPGAEEGGSLEV